MFRWVRRTVVLVKARWYGRHDGKLGIPEVSDATDVPGHIGELEQAGTAHVSDIERAFDLKDVSLLRKWRQRRSQLEAAMRVEAQAHEDEANARALLVERRQEFEDDRTGRRTDNDNRNQEWRMSSKAYIVAMVLMFVGELPLNAVAFEILRKGQILTLLMTSAVVVALLFCAHSLGVLLRLEKRSTVQKILVALLGIAPFLYAWMIGTIRSAYASVTGMADFGLTPRSTALVLGGINLFLYLVAVVLSYLAHDPAVRDVRVVEKSAKRASARARGAEKTTLMIRKKHDRAKARRLGKWNAAGASAVSHKRFYERAMQAYVNSNVAARSEHKKPAALKNLPRIELPRVFTNELEWMPSEFETVQGKRGLDLRTRDAVTSAITNGHPSEEVSIVRVGP